MAIKRLEDNSLDYYPFGDTPYLGMCGTFSQLAKNTSNDYSYTSPPTDYTEYIVRQVNNTIPIYISQNLPTRLKPYCNYSGYVLDFTKNKNSAYYYSIDKENVVNTLTNLTNTQIYGGEYDNFNESSTTAYYDIGINLNKYITYSVDLENNTITFTTTNGKSLKEVYKTAIEEAGYYWSILNRKSGEPETELFVVINFGRQLEDGSLDIRDGGGSGDSNYNVSAPIENADLNSYTHSFTLNIKSEMDTYAFSIVMVALSIGYIYNVPQEQ